MGADNQDGNTISVNDVFNRQQNKYLSSFSKTLGPGLRVGFVPAPDALLSDLRRRKFLTSLSGDAYVQDLVADFVDRRGYQKHLAHMREELGRRARIAKQQSAQFAQLGAFRGEYKGGLFGSFELRSGIDVDRLYRAARKTCSFRQAAYSTWTLRRDRTAGCA